MMDFFKVKKFRKTHKPNPEMGSEGDKAIPEPEQVKNGKCDELGNPADNVDAAAEAEDDDDDFIMDEVKRRLKELRRNSFMVLIPEESVLDGEEDDEEEMGDETDDAEAEGPQPWSGFDAVYDKYCEQMLSFDRLSAQQLNEVGLHSAPTTPSPRSVSKKLTSPFRCLSLKKMEESDDDTEHLQQPENDPQQDLESLYVAQVCLTWEALHSQYSQLNHEISCEPENSTCYNHSAQLFQQFQVLLQRFIENEPFEQGTRAEIYARSRNSLPKLLQVPKIQETSGSEQKETEEDESDFSVHASDLIKVIENSILTFRIFLKMDKPKPGGILNLFSNQNQFATPLQQIQSSLEKKEMRLKELHKKAKGLKKKSWPATQDEVELLLGLIDVKVLSRVLKTARITKEQLFWCEEKMKKLDISGSKLMRDPCPILFPPCC